MEINLQAKSWQIALVGNIILLLYTVWIIANAYKTLLIPSESLTDPAFAHGMSQLVIIIGIIALIVFSIITLLLYTSSTRIIGAALSIIFSIIGIYYLGFSGIALIFIFYLLAGIDCFWKKE